MADPLLLAQLGVGVLGGALAGRSERRARRRANEEARQAKKLIKETSAASAGLVLDTAAGAAAPLERIAETSAQDLRSPLLRDAISAGVRQQAEAENVRANAEGGALTGRRRAGQVLLRLLSSQGLGGAEQARVDRARQNLSLRAQLLRDAGAIRTEGARNAAGIQSQAASQIAGIRQDFGPDTALAGGFGGLSSALGNLSDDDKAAIGGLFNDLFSGEGGDPFSSSILGKGLGALGVDTDKFAGIFRAAT